MAAKPGNLIAAMGHERNVEWVAQGLFMHAVKEHEQVRQLVRDKLDQRTGTKCGAPLRGSSLAVTPEDPTSGGWRADVRIKGLCAKDMLVELKVLAGLTPRQKEAVASGKMDLLVLCTNDPRTRDEVAMSSATTIVTWAEIADAVGEEGDRCLARLLHDVDGYAVEWTVPEVSRHDISAEIMHFAGETSGALDEATKFLNQLDLLLRDRIDGYESSVRWSRSQRGEYVGYLFWLEGFKVGFWIGFQGGGADPKSCALELWQGNQERLATIEPAGGRWTAEDAAKQLEGSLGRRADE